MKQARHDHCFSARAFVLALALAVLGAAPAQTAPVQLEAELIEMLPLPAVALADAPGGAAALLEDGRLVLAGSTGVRTVRRDLDSEVLVSCGGALLAIDLRGRLIVAMAARGASDTASGTAVGPPVSLHATPLCLPDGGVLAIDPNGLRLMRLDRSLRVAAREMLPTLPDAAPVWLGDGLAALPVDATLRYRHGVLGDEVEAGGVAIVALSDLRVVGRWQVPAPRVIEDRRVVRFPAAGPWGVVATMSGRGDGGVLVVLGGDAAGFAPQALGAGFGQERRWRHTLGSTETHLYSVATPHLGGPLERWSLASPTAGRVLLERERFDLDVTSHRIGQRQLDLGTLLPRAPSDPAGVDLLLLPSRDLRGMRWVVCRPAGCSVAAVLELPAELATAPLAWRDAEGGVTVWVALADGSLLRARFPRDGILTDAE